MSAGDASSYRYWAFIAYSSEDKRWARWLRRAIEAYGIPARLVSQPTPAGDPAPKRFRPLFHDRTGVSAAADFGVEIEEALRASRYLIVICSPRAARSERVSKEIETFRRLGASERVLAVIVDGVPNAGDERECFPAALRESEPIAADARRDGDGKRNSRLKLLAGMLGVGFDALKQRDTHQRLRRFEVGIVLALILALGFAGLAVYAESQRAKAVKARHEAESILQYLQRDLRDKLQPLGRQDIVQTVQEKVDAYRRQLDTGAGAPDTLRKRGTAMTNGDRLEGQGDHAGALLAYRAALAIDESLASSDLRNADWQWNLAVDHESAGDVLRAQEDTAGALTEYRAAAEISEGLVSSDPKDTERQWYASWIHDDVGRMLEAQNDLAGALQEYRAALTIQQRLVLSNPGNAGWQRDESVMHSDVGSVLRQQGDLVGAQREDRAGLAIMERLTSSDPSNADWQRELSIRHSDIGNVLEDQGDLAGALRQYRARSAIAERLTASDPNNTEWQQDVNWARDDVARVLSEQSDTSR